MTKFVRRNGGKRGSGVSLPRINYYYGGRVRKGVDSPVGVCDTSGQYHNHSDLAKQMEWRGDNLIWTGFLVGKDFLDPPNEQRRTPPIRGEDPEIVHDPRPRLPSVSIPTNTTSLAVPPNPYGE